MPSILKIWRDWSLLHFEIRRDRSPHKIWKILRDWSFPFGESGVPRLALMLPYAVGRFSFAASYS